MTKALQCGYGGEICSQTDRHEYTMALSASLLEKTWPARQTPRLLQHELMHWLAEQLWDSSTINHERTYCALIAIVFGHTTVNGSVRLSSTEMVHSLVQPSQFVMSTTTNLQNLTVVRHRDEPMHMEMVCRYVLRDLYRACVIGDLEIVKRCVEIAGPACVLVSLHENTPDDIQRPLLTAMAFQHYDLVRYMCGPVTCTTLYAIEVCSANIHRIERGLNLAMVAYVLGGFRMLKLVFECAPNTCIHKWLAHRTETKCTLASDIVQRTHRKPAEKIAAMNLLFDYGLNMGDCTKPVHRCNTWDMCLIQCAVWCGNCEALCWLYVRYPKACIQMLNERPAIPLNFEVSYPALVRCAQRDDWMMLLTVFDILKSNNISVNDILNRYVSQDKKQHLLLEKVIACQAMNVLTILMEELPEWRHTFLWKIRPYPPYLSHFLNTHHFCQNENIIGGDDGGGGGGDDSQVVNNTRTTVASSSFPSAFVMHKQLCLTIEEMIQTFTTKKKEWMALVSLSSSRQCNTLDNDVVASSSLSTTTQATEAEEKDEMAISGGSSTVHVEEDTRV